MCVFFLLMVNVGNYACSTDPIGILKNLLSKRKWISRHLSWFCFVVVSVIPLPAGVNWISMDTV